MSLVEAVFGLLGVVAVASALLVVTTHQLVHAALWLVVTLGAVAGCYLLLSAEFVAWVQVLIYVGAVVVLLLFGLMLTKAPIGVSLDLDGPPLQRAAAAVVAVGLAAVVCVAAVLRLERAGAGHVRPPETRVFVPVGQKPGLRWPHRPVGRVTLSVAIGGT